MALVSVLIPCRNEFHFIEPCVRSVLTNGYASIEVFIIDGGSTDGTRSRAEALTADQRVHVLDNPAGTTPIALNMGLAHCHGEHVLRLDAHAELEPGYIGQCVRHLKDDQKTVNIGGIVKAKPVKSGFVADAIATVLGHPFGVGPSRFRIGISEPRLVDTVYGGCYRREWLRGLDGWDARLSRGQDYELNARVRLIGGSIMCDPSLATTYRPPSTLSAFIRQTWQNGRWAVRAMRLTGRHAIALRHLAPLVALILWALALIASPSVALGLAVLYIAAALLASVAMTWNGNADLGPFVFIALIVLHGCYGAGSLYEIVSGVQS